MHSRSSAGGCARATTIGTTGRAGGGDGRAGGGRFNQKRGDEEGCGTSGRGGLGARGRRGLIQKGGEDGGERGGLRQNGGDEGHCASARAGGGERDRERLTGRVGSEALAASTGQTGLGEAGIGVGVELAGEGADGGRGGNGGEDGTTSGDGGEEGTLTMSIAKKTRLEQKLQITNWGDERKTSPSVANALKTLTIRPRVVADAHVLSCEDYTFC